MRIGWTVAVWALAGTAALSGCRKNPETARNESNPEALPGAGGAGGTHRAQNRGGVMGEASDSSTQNKGPVQGTVTQVGQDKLQLQTPAGPEIVQADKKTEVIVGGLPVQGLGYVPEGSQVRATFRGSGGDATAERIEVLDVQRGQVEGFGSTQSPNQPAGSLGQQKQQQKQQNQRQ